MKKDFKVNDYTNGKPLAEVGVFHVGDSTIYHLCSHADICGPKRAEAGNHLVGRWKIKKARSVEILN